MNGEPNCRKGDEPEEEEAHEVTGVGSGRLRHGVRYSDKDELIVGYKQSMSAHGYCSRMAT